MNRALLEGEKKALQARLDVLERIKPDCNSCINLSASGDCLAHKASVPDDFKKTGCDQWEWDDVPF